MHIVVNSDVLRAGDYVNMKTVPKHHRKVYEKCAELGGHVHVPRTSLLEFETYLQAEVSSERSKLEGALARLDRYEIKHDKQDPADLVQMPSLEQLIRDCGVEVVVEEPSNEDLREAHDRACTHSPPHAPDQSGEMRDTVIWLISLRIARENNGALLISRDGIHRSRFGDEEAARVGLTRVKEFSFASSVLGIETPALSIVRALVLPVWNDLINMGLPISEEPSLRQTSNEVFRNSATGLEHARASIVVDSNSGAELSADVEFSIQGDKIIKVGVIGAESDGISLIQDPVFADVDRHSDVIPSEPLSDKIESLRKMIGG